MTAEWERGIRRIYNVLKDRGFGDKYEYILDCWKAEKGCYFGAIEAEEKAQQQVMDKLMQMPLQEVRSSGWGVIAIEKIGRTYIIKLKKLALDILDLK